MATFSIARTLAGQVTFWITGQITFWVAVQTATWIAALVLVVSQFLTIIEVTVVQVITQDIGAYVMRLQLLANG